MMFSEEHPCSESVVKYSSCCVKIMIVHVEEKTMSSFFSTGRIVLQQYFLFFFQEVLNGFYP